MSTRTSPPTFALLGAAGFVAPRHLAAIAALGGELLVACDPHDSVGVLDRYFPRASFLHGPSELQAWVSSPAARPIDYWSICTPNDQHAEHIRLALRCGSSAICEKPVTLEPHELEQLVELEGQGVGRVHPVLQLREHPRLLELRAALPQSVHDVELTYVTTRGPWYQTAWKGHEQRSGGLIFAVGIHFVDLLLWLFGPAEDSRVFVRDSHRARGTLELERARVRWFLSIDGRDLPADVRARGQATFRSIRVDGTEVEFSEKFEHLHQAVYARILRGEGLAAADALPAIRLAHSIRRSELHPMAAGAPFRPQ